MREGHYTPGEPVTLGFEVDEEKPRSCHSGNSPAANWTCYLSSKVQLCNNDLRALLTDYFPDCGKPNCNSSVTLPGRYPDR